MKRKGILISLTSFQGFASGLGDARKTAQLAEKIRSLYTGRTSRANTLLEKRARRMGDHEGGEGAWAGRVFWRLWLLFPFFFYWPASPDAAAAVPSIP